MTSFNFRDDAKRRIDKLLDQITFWEDGDQNLKASVDQYGRGVPTAAPIYRAEPKRVVDVNLKDAIGSPGDYESPRLYRDALARYSWQESIRRGQRTQADFEAAQGLHRQAVEDHERRRQEISQSGLLNKFARGVVGAVSVPSDIMAGTFVDVAKHGLGDSSVLAAYGQGASPYEAAVEELEKLPVFQQIGASIFTPSGAIGAVGKGVSIGLRSGGKAAPAVVNKFFQPVKSLQDNADEVVQSVTSQVPNSSLAGRIVGGIVNAPTKLLNPSAAEGGVAHQLKIGYVRTAENQNAMVENALRAAVDPHTNRLTGNLDVLARNADGIMPDFGKHWGDVLSDARLVARLSPEARAFSDDYHQVIRELIQLAADNGVKMPKEFIDPDNLWIPRGVQEIRGIDVPGRTDHFLRRVYELQTEGIEAGVKYDNDPRNVLKLFGQSVMKSIRDTQLDEAVEVISVTPKQVVSAAVRQTFSDAAVQKQRVTAALRTTQRALLKTEATERGMRAGSKAVAKTVDELLNEYDEVYRVIQDARIAVGRDPLRVGLDKATLGVRVARKSVHETEKLLGRTLIDQAYARGRLRHLGQYEDHLMHLFDLYNDGRAARRLARLTPATTVRALERQLAEARKVLEAHHAVVKAELTSAEKLQNSAQVAWSARLKELGSASQAAKRRVRLDAALARATKQEDKLLLMRGARQAQAAQLKKDIATLKQMDVDARTEWHVQRGKYTRELEAAKHTNQVPGALWGPNQPNEIPVKMWRNRLFRVEDEAQLNKGLELLTGQAHTAVRAQQVVGEAVQTFSATADFALPGVHLLPIFMRNPVAWGRATLTHYAAFADPQVQANFARKHIKSLQEMANAGLIGPESEYFTAAVKGDANSVALALQKIPVVGKQGYRQSLGRFQASYETGLLVGRTLMWEASLPFFKVGGNAAQRSQAIRNMTGGLSTKALGVSPNQRGIESLWLAFSPRLLRSTMALTKDLIRPDTAPGRESWKAMGALVAGATSIYVTVGLATGHSEAEIRDGLNPLNGRRFMSYKVQDSWVGVGGQIRAIMQMMAQTASVLGPGGRDIEDILKLDLRANPLLAYYYSRGPVAFDLVGSVVEGSTGANMLPYDDVDGGMDIVKHMGTSFLPFAVQSWVEGENQSGPLSLASLGGARVTPETVDDKKFEVYQQLQESGAIPWQPPPGVTVTVDNYNEVLPTKIRALLNDDPGVKAKQAEGERTEYMVLQAQWAGEQKENDDAFLKSWHPRMTGQRKREAVKAWKRTRWELREAIFEDAVAAWKKGEDTGVPIEDAMAEFYWSVPLENHPVTGEPLWTTFKADRKAVLDQAKTMGIDTNFFITDKSRRSDNPDVLEKVGAYERATEILLPYWELGQSIAAQNNLGPIYALYSRSPQEVQSRMLASAPQLRQLVTFINKARMGMRATNKEIDLALIEWYDFDPLVLK